MIPIPIAFSIKGTTEMILAALIMIGANLYEDNYGERSELVLCSTGIHRELIIKPTHKYRGNNFCPTYCGVDHTHKAHINTYKCDKDVRCDHIIYFNIIF